MYILNKHNTMEIHIPIFIPVFDLFLLTYATSEYKIHLLDIYSLVFDEKLNINSQLVK